MYRLVNSSQRNTHFDGASVIRLIPGMPPLPSDRVDALQEDFFHAVARTPMPARREGWRTAAPIRELLQVALDRVWNYPPDQRSENQHLRSLQGSGVASTRDTQYKATICNYNDRRRDRERIMRFEQLENCRADRFGRLSWVARGR